MSYFTAIHSLLGMPNAEDEARRFLDQKAAENAAAVTGAQPPGAADPANVPAAAAPAVAGPPIGVAQPGPGEAQAYQTPKSWGSIMLDLSRQQQQEQVFNRSLGGIFAQLSQ